MKTCVVIPCYKVKLHILDVISKIPPQISKIYIVDDCCPENSADHVEINNNDSRVTILRHTTNLGVGGAMKTGFQAAIKDGMEIVVKIDGDGQMDPLLIPYFVNPIISGKADYTKGNRFFNLQHISRMPAIRIFGNSMLSLMTKLSSGYWNLFDVNNGYLAIHREVLKCIDLNLISNRYFFETDLLFNAGLIRSKVIDVPMDAIYGDEKSNLKINKIFFEFLVKHIRNFLKRIFYNYFLRDTSLASIELLIGVSFLVFGTVFGGSVWIHAMQTAIPTPLGTIMLAALSVILGIQFVIAFLSYDISNIPKDVIHR